MQKKLTILSTFLLLVWLLPFVQTVLPFIKSDKVRGSFVAAKDTTLNLQTWWEGTYQKKKNSYLNDNVGFYSDFVRINNQLDYSCFGELHAKSVLIGKENYLYEKAYIDAMIGRDFKGGELMQQRMERLSRLKAALEKKGTQVLVILAPNKARTYPEFLPDSLQFPPKDSSNYNVCIANLKRYQIPYIDVLDWFLKEKKTSPYPLFAKYGTHWSEYGVGKMTDSLAHYLNQKGLFTPKTAFTVRQEKNKSAITKSSDYDIGLGLNLILPLPIDSLATPVIHYENPENRPKISPIIISDSFWWMFIGRQDIANQLFDKWLFWNYYKEEWTDVVMKGKEREKRLTLEYCKTEVGKHPLIIFIIAEGNLQNFGFGLLDKDEYLWL